ncbi:MAG: hypothetical protein NZ922_01125 [Candidatus Methanomethyliaceae archaeon]|nr:hypothetical protein [Candidatus Methanomethyliaceae archaeon]MDW7971465.1 hypothetical protein [Nitrososphaerota archaeon]
MRKLKIEFCDGSGNKITVVCNGGIEKERIVKLLEIFEIKKQERTTSRRTIRDNILEIIFNDLKDVWFTSKDVAMIYFRKFNENIKPSTVSTYLSRLYDEGYFERIGNRNCWQYRLIPKTSTKSIEEYLKEFYNKSD